MARNVDTNKPLSDEDREYLNSRGQHELVARIDAEHGMADDAAAGEDLSAFGGNDRLYEEWTLADIDQEIDERNADEDRPADRRLAKSGNKTTKVAMLRSDDQWIDSQAS